MIDLCRLIWFAFVGLFRSRASLEAELLALRHELNILRRKSPKRPNLSNHETSCRSLAKLDQRLRQLMQPFDDAMVTD
jgi:hypothetical protein